MAIVDFLVMGIEEGAGAEILSCILRTHFSRSVIDINVNIYIYQLC